MSIEKTKAELLAILNREVNTPADFQERVDALFELQKNNRTGDPLPEMAFSQTAEPDNSVYENIGLKELESAFYVVGQDRTEDEKRIYLASVSKIAIATVAEKIAKDKEVNSLTVNKAVLIEVIERNQLASALHRECFKHYLPGIDQANDPMQFAAENLPEELEISMDDLMYLTLVLSCNKSVTVLKNFASKQLGGNEVVEKMMAEMVPGYAISFPSENYNWIQEASNTGFLSEFAKLQHEMVVKLMDSGEESKTLEFMSNNPEDFGLDFTNSDYGKELISQGYKIIEKTGTYPDGVNWVKALAERGLPFHSPFLTVVTIVPPKTDNVQKPPVTFAYYKAFETPRPAESTPAYSEEMEVTDINGKAKSAKFTANFPNVYDFSNPGYKAYLEWFNPTACSNFRSELVEKAKVVLAA